MDRPPLESLEHSVEELVAIVESLSDKALDATPGEGKWSIRQTVHHLADECNIWPLCIKKAIVTPGGRVQIEGFPGNDAWVEGLAYDHRSVGPALDLLQAERRYLSELLRHFEHAWDHTVVLVDAEKGEERTLSVADIVALLTEHVKTHLKIIRGILNR